MRRTKKSDAELKLRIKLRNDLRDVKKELRKLKSYNNKIIERGVDFSKARYISYISHSKRWREFRKWFIRRSGNKCELCGDKDARLNCHHVGYDYVFYEIDHPESVRVLCRDCHKFYHDITD